MNVDCTVTIQTMYLKAIHVTLLSVAFTWLGRNAIRRSMKYFRYSLETYAYYIYTARLKRKAQPKKNRRLPMRNLMIKWKVFEVLVLIMNARGL